MVPAETLVTELNKATIIPIYPIEAELQASGQSFVLLPEESVTFGSISNWLSPSNFELWKEYVSEKQRKQLSAADFALIHTFKSSGHVGKEEQVSQDLLNKVATCLRIIRPTRSRSPFIQLRLLDSGAADVFSFTQPIDQPMNAPQSVVLNTVRTSDLRELQRTIGKFLRLAAGDTYEFNRAVRYFMAGYMQIDDPVIQIMVWTAGIEALLSTCEFPGDSLSKLFQLIDPNWNIYEDAGFQQFVPVQVRLDSVAENLFLLRNRFAHGGWVPPEWANKEARPPIGRSVEYADMIREAAAAILRKLLLIKIDSD